MVAAEHEPSFETEGAPISVLLDFDGTVSLQDVGNELLGRLAPDQAEAERMGRLYNDGAVGSRQLTRWDMDVLPRDRDLLLDVIAGIDLDESLVGLVDFVGSVGGVVEIVSDGIGVHIEPMLARFGLSDVPVATNQAVLGRGGDGVTFPYGNSACFVCGTCKRERVRKHQDDGRVVVFVGDGPSDRYAAHHADIVFAKDALATWCSEAGVSHVPWARLSDVTESLDSALASGELPSERSAFGSWAARHRSEASYICGPEVWPPARLGVLSD
jgi:2-hydroxy-3-keto-5-methylthiopentenyl-1-phosphate phosphatase